MAKDQIPEDSDKKHARWACQKVIKAVHTGLYGSILFQFIDGKIVRTVTEISEKPPGT